MPDNKEELLTEFKILNENLNKQLWKLSGHLSNELESALTIMENMIRNINERLEKNGTR